MGVHGVRVVSASLFNCASLRSSKNRGNYPKAFFSKKNRSSLQNGCAYSLSLYKMGARTWVSLFSYFLVRLQEGSTFGNTDGDV